MDAPALSTLSTLSADTLARRLRDLVADERQVQVDFLLHLSEFDARRAWAEAGYDSLWSYCTEALHLREGPAGRRIGAMRVLRRFPALEGALRDGRLCLSTVTLLGPLLTPENLDDLVARAAYGTKSAVEHLVATLQPRTPPRDGIRRLPQRGAAAPAQASASASSAALPLAPPQPIPPTAPAAAVAPPETAHPTRPRAELRPISEEEFSLVATIDASLRADLELLQHLVSHKCGRNLVAVLREAVRCAIEKHGRRKGAVKPSRERASKPPIPPVPGDRAIPLAVRREVWERDGGRCAWTVPGGRRCGSRWKLQLDHIQPVALGGASTVANLRVTCSTHNALAAEQIFGRAHMARFNAESAFPRMNAERSTTRT